MKLQCRGFPTTLDLFQSINRCGLHSRPTRRTDLVNVNDRREWRSSQKLVIEINVTIDGLITGSSRPSVLVAVREYGTPRWTIIHTRCEALLRSIAIECVVQSYTRTVYRWLAYRSLPTDA